MKVFFSTSICLLTLLLQCSTADAELAGTWVGNVTCGGQYIEPQPWPLTVNVIGANGHYTVTASTPNAAGTGTINGSSVSFTLQMLMNAAHFSGRIVGNRMSGTYVQGGSGPCSWFASSPTATKPQPSISTSDAHPPKHSDIPVGPTSTGPNPNPNTYLGGLPPGPPGSGAVLAHPPSVPAH
jgi:hypothetical protein